MELKGKNVLVVGAGKTGMALAEFLVGKGAQVTLNDQKPRPDNFTLPHPAIKTVWGGHPEGLFLAAELILLSPGVPLHLSPIQSAIKKGIPAMGELELATQFINFPLIAITGTNGKTTTTTLTGEMMKEAGITTFVGGNIGQPLLKACMRPKNYQWGVIEVSSFQLATAPHFHPRIAAILNMEPDHLDWHPTLEDYYKSKWAIARHMTAEELLVLYAPLHEQRLSPLSPRIQTFTQVDDTTCTAFIRAETLCWQFGIDSLEIPVSDLVVQQVHLHLDMLTAGLLAHAVGVSTEVIANVLKRFHGLPHRTEFVGVINGIRFINDSKATNVDAVFWALKSLPKPIIWLAGGLWKGGNLAALTPLVKKKIKAVIAFGDSAERFNQAFQSVTPTQKVETMEEAVIAAYRLAQAGDTVLLSPACASFDQFDNYKERGQVFTVLVTSLKPKGEEIPYVSE
jgi:UDP-N-acetylmuramoylalanine--D-glutamate ligase